LHTLTLYCTAICRYVDRLERIHAHVKEAEEETQLSRREFVKKIRRKTRERLKEMQKESHKEEEEILVRRRSSFSGNSFGRGGTFGKSAGVQAAREAALRKAKEEAAKEAALKASTRSSITEDSELDGVSIAPSLLGHTSV
jgi:hypothetical protein